MTDEQARVLRHLHEYRGTHGISPTLDDLARMGGLSSRNGIRAHLQALIRDGHVIAAAGSRPGYVVSRGYRLSASGLAALAESGASTTPTTCPECGQPIAGGAR